jgi:hypothetical protein
MSSGTATVLQHGPGVDAAWSLLRAASAAAERLDRSGRFEMFRADTADGLQNRA